MSDFVEAKTPPQDNPCNQLSLGGSYQFELPASLTRAWENVFDWEHLPHVHSSSFNTIKVLSSGSWGWRAEVGLGEQANSNKQIIELVTEQAELRYVSQVLSGDGAGTEIWTRFKMLGEHRTEVVVEFWFPLDDAKMLRYLGQAYTEVYKQLWAEDQAMMVQRQQQLDQLAVKSASATKTLNIGALASLEFPLSLCFNDSVYWVIASDNDLLVYPQQCPHMLGPLQWSEQTSSLRCAWHDYQFDIKTGACISGHNCRLTKLPSIHLNAQQEVIIVA